MKRKEVSRERETERMREKELESMYNRCAGGAAIRDDQRGDKNENRLHAHTSPGHPSMELYVPVHPTQIKKN